VAVKEEALQDPVVKGVKAVKAEKETLALVVLAVGDSQRKGMTGGTCFLI
jgi:hypothetical protein